MEKVISYTEALTMSYEDLLEVNYALNRYIDLSKEGGK